MTARNVSRLSDAKRVLLERRLRGLSGASAHEGVRRRDGDGPAPLSPAQRGVWLADQLRADTSVSGVYRVMWLRGALDRDAFAAAVGDLVARHEVLRTTYRPEGDDAVQIVGVAAVPLTITAATGSTVDERRAAALAAAGAAAAESFDLVNGPLFTVSLTEVDAEEHLLFVRMHHLLTDEWSCGLLARELAAMYAGRRDGRAHGLPALPVQYADFAAWLAAPAQVETREKHAEWWKETLTDVPPVLELPTDRIRPDVPSYKGGVERLTLSPEASAGLRALASAQGATLFSALLALFGSVLHKYSGQARFAVGSLLSGRGRPEVENMMGMFASTVAIPLDFSGSPSFGEVLSRTGGSVVGALDHQDATVDQVVAGLRLPREAGRNPLFQALFQCVEVSEHEWDFAGLAVEPVWFDAGLAKVDLTLIAVNEPSGITLELTYAEDLYLPAFATRLLAHLSNVVDIAVADAGTRVADADMLTEGERRAALVEWNATGMEYPTEDTVHGLFEKWAAREPGLPAIWKLDGTPVSYGELNAMANRLAHYLRDKHGLRDHGVGRETLVGVCAEHSVEMFVILLGVLKAGGAYVPLDASLPASRLEWILTDTAAPIVVTTENLRGAVPAFDGEILAVDTSQEAIAAYPDHDPEPLSTSDNLLYTIYTSGSTGRPKGVLVPHRGVVNYLWWAIEGYGLEGERGAPMLGSIAFDLSVPNFWLPFIGGKCTTLLPTDKSLESLAARLSEPGDFSLLKITPGHLDVMRGMLEPGQVRSVRTFVVGADEVRPETVSGWRAIAPGARVINEYGPTETVVGCSIYEVPEEFDPSISVSIGKPIGNLRMYVLDAGLNPAPVGVVGELYIGGDGVARGYLNRPELTAAKFVPDPFGNPGDRLYRTGDLARYRADGDFEFLGRTDFQVKVRGYRIELGEVEARLGLHPAVTEAVAAVVTGHGGHKRLAGYVVCDGEAPSSADLKAFMAEVLPEYMVPQVFVTLDAMPLTSAGKVDRTALPAPGAVRRESAVRPSNPAEETLAGIWRDVLGVPKVGVGDNFFELGGDSILAIRVIGKAREAGLSLTPAALFTHQTVAELAASVGAAHTAHAEQGVLTGETGLTPVQHWFTGLDAPRDHYNQSARVAYPGGVDADALRAALARLVEHHDALRLRVPEDGPARFDSLDLATPGDVDLLRVVVDGDREAEATAAHTSLSLTHGPLLRGVLFRGDDGDELLIAVHHMAVDTVSWGVLLEDLAALLKAAPLDGRPLPRKTTSMRHWAKRLAEYAESPEFAAEDAHWRAKAAELAAVPPPPTDLPPDTNRLGDAKTLLTRLSGDETAPLLRAVPTALRAGTDEVLLAALARACGLLWGDTPYAVDLEGHGREDLFPDVDLTRTVGWFTSVRPVALRASGEDPRAWVDAVKTEVRHAWGNGIGYGIARHLRGGDWPAAGAPAICFNFLSTVDDSADGVPGVERSPDGRRPYLLEVTACVLNGELWVGWQYGTGCHDESTIAKLAHAFEDALRDLTRTARDAGREFPLAELSASETAAFAGAEDVYRLTPLQTGMLFQTAARPEDLDYIEQFVYSLDGPLDADALREAWAFTFARHQSLRASFAWRGLPHPVQVVHPNVDLRWTALDLRGAGDADARIDALRADPLPLEDRPPHRFTLVRVGEESHRLVWTFHHIAVDGWSVPIVLGEVMAAYRSLTAGNGLPELEAPAPYRDYAAWLAGRRGETPASYWSASLAGIRAATPIPAVTGDDPGEVRLARVTLPAAESDRITAFARGHKVTPGTVLQAAWALVLARGAQSGDVVFGSILAGRSAPVPGIERVVGLLMNTLPVRVTVADTPVGEWLRGVHTRLGSLRDHEHAALAEVRRAATIPPGTELFHSIFVHENFAAPEENTGADLRLELERAYEQSGYPLVLGAGVHDGLYLALNYDSGRVTDADAEALLAEYAEVLAALTAPGAVLSAIAPVTRAAVVAVTEKVTAGYRAPSGPVEELLAGLWEEVLDVARVGADDDFFGLGGDSILAMQVIARVRDHGMTLRPRDFARTPTVSALAAKASATAPEAVRTGGLDLTLSGRDGVTSVHRLGPLQTGMLFHVLGETGGNDYLQVFAYDVTAPLDVQAFRDAWQAAVDRHAAMRTVFAWEDLPHPVQAILSESTVDFRVLDRTDRPGDLDALIAAEQAGPVDLTAAPPTRITAIHMGPGRWSFLWRSHHMVLDGLSAGIVCDEVIADYLARLDGRPSPAVEPAPYEEYLAWIENAGTGDAETHWRDALGGFASPTPLPEGTGDGTGSGVVHAEAPAGLATALDALARGQRVTVGAVLHAAWGLYLARRTGREDVVFGTTVAGRSAPVRGAEHMVGMLMNTLPVRVRTTESGLGEWLRRTHRDLGELREFEHHSLVDVQRLTEVPAGRRLFESILVYQSVRGGDELPGGFAVRLGEEAVDTDYPLVLDAIWHGGLSLQLNYERGRYTRAEAEAITGGFLDLLAALTSDAGASPAAIAARVLPAGRAVTEEVTARTPAGFVAPKGEAETALAAIWSQILGVERVGAADDFYELGGDSILAIQVVGKARKAGLPITTKHILTHRTIAGIGARTAMPVVPTVSVESRPLTRDEAALLARALAVPGSHHHQITIAVDPRSIAATWRDLAERHPVLRTTIEWDAPDGPVARVHASPADIEVTSVDDLPAWLAVERTRGLDVRAPQRLDLVGGTLVWQFSSVLIEPGQALALLREIGTAQNAGEPATDEPVGSPAGPVRPEAIRVLTGVLRTVLGREPLADERIDEADAVRLSVLAAREGAAVTVADVLTRPTIEALAAVAKVGATAIEDDPIGPIEPTPVHRWFARLDVPHHHYNQANLLDIAGDIDAGTLERALHTVVAHHDALRLRMTADGEHVAATESARLLRTVDLTGLADPEAVMRAAGTEANASLDLADGPILRGVLYTGDGPARLQLAVHHLAIDNVSWGPLLEDLEAAYDAHAVGTEPVLPQKTTSFRRWASRLAEYSRSAAFAPEAAYWRDRPVPHAPLPVDHMTGPNTEGSTEEHVSFVDAATTAKLVRPAAGLHRAGVHDLLIAALAGVIAEWSGHEDIRLDLEGHGREDLFDDVDLTRTVGWFTAVRPLELHPSADVSETVALVRAALRGIDGIGHGLAVEGFDGGEIVVNYHGHQTGTAGPARRFTAVEGPVGVTRAPEGVRQYLLEVDAGIAEDRMYVIWKYSRNRHHKSTVEHLAAALDERLRAIAAVDVRRPRPATDLVRPGSPALAVPMARHRIPGFSVAVLRDGELAGTWASGSTGDGPVTPDTPFPVGSGSKYPAALAVLRLAQDGVLDLDAPADSHLRSWKIGSPATIRQLLAHTAGLSFAGYEGHLPGEPVPGLLDVLEGRGSTPAARPEEAPGGRFRYSGSHYSALQVLLEDVTGTPFARLSHDLVLDPLGMTGSGYVPGSTIGHDEAGNPLPPRVFSELAAAGLWSTAADMARLLSEVHKGFHQAGSVFLTRESATVFLDPMNTGDVGRTPLHGIGDVPGHRCFTLADTRVGSGTVILVNSDAGRLALDEISDTVVSYIVGDETHTGRV